MHAGAHGTHYMDGACMARVPSYHLEAGPYCWCDASNRSLRQGQSLVRTASKLSDLSVLQQHMPCRPSTTLPYACVSTEETSWQAGKLYVLPGAPQRINPADTHTYLYHSSTLCKCTRYHPGYSAQHLDRAETHTYVYILAMMEERYLAQPMNLSLGLVQRVAPIADLSARSCGN